MNPAHFKRLIDGASTPIDQHVSSLFSSLSRPTVHKRADRNVVEDQVLVLAIAFSAHGALASTSAIVAQTRPDDVPELLKPNAEELCTLRELDELGMSMALVGDLPQPLLERMAAVLCFSGQSVSAIDPLAALPTTFGLPAACIWFVTADGGEARRAFDAGFTAVHIASRESTAIECADGRGFYVLKAIEDLVDAIRAPYTRSAINLRLIIGAVIHAKLDWLKIP